MDEFTSRAAVNQIIAAQCGECADACLEFDGIQPDCNQCLLHGVKKAIESIPAADVRPVVLCRDCKHYQGVHNCQGHAPCDYWGIGGVLWNDFCSRGVKMEES